MEKWLKDGDSNYNYIAVRKFWHDSITTVMQIAPVFIGYAEAKWCIHLVGNIIAHADTYNEAVRLRREIWEETDPKRYKSLYHWI